MSGKAGKYFVVKLSISFHITRTQQSTSLRFSRSQFSLSLNKTTFNGMKTEPLITPGSILFFTSRESRSILVTPSHGLFVTIYTELTRMSRCVRKVPCRFSSVLRNFPFNLSSCTKGSMLIFVFRFDFLRDVYETFRDIFHAVHKIFWEIVSFLLISQS